MLQTIEWPLGSVFFQGRNGCYPCVGVEVLRPEKSDTLHISPLCRRGVANAFIEIPCDRIDELIQLLRDTQAEYRGDQLSATLAKVM